MLSLVIPVYRNEENLPRLFRELEGIARRLAGNLEIVFVVDGSPDASLRILRETLPTWRVRTQLVELCRNFGSFAAIAAGLSHGRGDYFAVIAADLQEPPELVVDLSTHSWRSARPTSCSVTASAAPIRGRRRRCRSGSGGCIADS